MEFSRKLAAARQCRVYQKQRESVLFGYRPSTSPVSPRRHMHITLILCLRLWLLLLSFSLSLSLSPLRSLSPATLPLRSSPVKSYLVTARNMLCEPTYPFAFTYRSGAVPRTTEESHPATVETIENTPSRASLVGGFWNPRLAADAASRRLA